jgi:hypothetical protein
MKRLIFGRPGNVSLDQRAMRFVADIVAKVENRTTQKISRKLVFRLLYGYLAFRSREEGP